MRRFAVALVRLVGIVSICLPGAIADEPQGLLRVATFRADVTPVVDGTFYGGWGQSLRSLEAPLWAKGVVLETGAARYVLCAVDWCTLGNSAHTLFCRKLADAAATAEAQQDIQRAPETHHGTMTDVEMQTRC